MGLPVSATIPLAYQVVSLVSIVAFARTKRYRLFRATQLTLMLLLPFLLQWSLGGFAASSVVSLWALIAPLGALMFVGTRGALPWFAAYMVLLGISGLIDPLLGRAEIPDGIRLLFFVLNVAGVSLTAYLLLQYFVRQRERAMTSLDREHKRSERLLLNVLPGPIAERLKEREEVIADGFPEATVLFADIVDFTPLAGRLAPDEVVELLDEIFSEFDGLADTFGLEKIKTIGDAYMVAGGIPSPRPDHLEAVARMGVAMLRAVESLRAGGPLGVQLRIGIDTGPVVAGVIGRRKFIYDLWGDTVNTASRMESEGVPGRIQVTRSVVERLDDRFRFEPRGLVDVKGKGPMRTWFLIGSDSPVQ